MSQTITETEVNIPSVDLNGPRVANSVNLQEKYAQERDKRLRTDATGQFVNAKAVPDAFKHLFEDVWIAPGTPINQPVKDGGHSRVIVLGAGFGGLLFAIRLMEKAGFKPEDFVFVDAAGDFGGTWYWNRYPGLMCDTESYIYMPLLEEMDYMPKQKYASGEELRLYTESIAKKYGLEGQAMFQSIVKAVTWSDDRKQWDVEILQQPKGGDQTKVNISTDFFFYCPGPFHTAKLPKVEGSETFANPMLHTSRWRYDITGGTSAKPDLTKLQDKRVAIIGTGATAVQVVPQLAKWAKELYVVQRTPSSVDVRGNHDTDPATWKSKVATAPGWQRARSLNFSAFVNNHEKKPEVDLVSDGWTGMPSYSGILGTPRKVTMDTLDEYLTTLRALDDERQTRIQQRALDTVKDSETAKNLQPYYNGWCKRPCFHDHYLPAFNQPNVHLVDTDGQGVERITEKGVVVRGHEYEIDVLVWSTGYESSAIGLGASDIVITGKDGMTLNERATKGWSTLHGVISRGFPNMFWAGPLQSGTSPSFTFVADELATHVAEIVAQAQTRTGGSKVVVEPSEAAVEEWAATVMPTSLKGAGMAGCTPGYMNGEGTVLSDEQKMLFARASPYANGLVEYLDVIGAWRAEGSLKGLEITS